MLAFLMVAAISGVRALPTADVTFGPLTLNAGESGYIPVYITASSPTLLYFFSFSLTITGAALTFDDSLPPAEDPTFSATEYVFFGNSQDGFFDQPLGYAFSATQFEANDTADNSTPGPIGAGPRLLGFVPVTADDNLLGDVSISLNAAQFLIWDDFLSSLDYTSSPGMVSVVPEPSSAALLGVALAGLIAAACRYRRKPLARISRKPAARTSSSVNESPDR